MYAIVKAKFVLHDQYFDGSGWTTDISQALHFTSRSDAQRECEIQWEFEDCVVVAIEE